MDVPTPADDKRARCRLASIREDISTRLWPVMQGMSSPSFNELMDHMALLQFRGEQQTVDDHCALERRLGQADRRTLGVLLRPGRLIVAGEPDDPQVT